ncbi:SHOCT domain-containing protein [Flavobacterium cellulosilyticum]|uniref:SHOCT domain-containing protein n=1 Tax=Flavobacterium cellulosilyticum TaxID=2541731 RepID=A0A4R5CDE2_9FLAO|nr:SHOCT domain-containing protein [Flavobacterium cellulosilyticum]
MTYRNFKRRYASGEITKEQFEDMKNNIS